LKAYAWLHGHEYSDPHNERKYDPVHKQWRGGILRPHVYDPAVDDQRSGFGNEPSGKSLGGDLGPVPSGPYSTNPHSEFAPPKPAPVRSQAGVHSTSGTAKKQESATHRGESGEKKGAGGKSSLLDDIAALSSLLADPESLHDAKESGNRGSGAQYGSKSGIITGWLAQVLAIGMVFGGKLLDAVKKLGANLKEKIGKLLEGKHPTSLIFLDPKADQRLLAPGIEPAPPSPPAQPKILTDPPEPIGGGPFRPDPPTIPAVDPSPTTPEPDPWDLNLPDKNRRR
jgi:hypothetical protein